MVGVAARRVGNTDARGAADDTPRLRMMGAVVRRGARKALKNIVDVVFNLEVVRWWMIGVEREVVGGVGFLDWEYM